MMHCDGTGTQATSTHSGTATLELEVLHTLSQ
jgi:hypothetical protein